MIPFPLPIFVLSDRKVNDAGQWEMLREEEQCLAEGVGRDPLEAGSAGNYCEVGGPSL